MVVFTIVVSLKRTQQYVCLTCRVGATTGLSINPVTFWVRRPSATVEVGAGRSGSTPGGVGSFTVRIVFAYATSQADSRIVT